MKRDDGPDVVTTFDADAKMLHTRVRLSEVQLALIVYGARCVWWDNIEGAALHRDSGLPCCPHCGSVLFQVEEATWWQHVEAHEAAGNPDYRKLIEWLRGKCFHTMDQAQRAYDREPQA